MAGHFEPLPGGGAAVALDEVEISILRSLAVQLLELIGPGDEPAEGEDPLAALFAEAPANRPTDPALARLFPDGVRRRRRRANCAPRPPSSAASPRTTCAPASATTPSPSSAPWTRSSRPGTAAAILKLTADECRNWLGALNDLRLTIGTRLDVTDEDEGGEDRSTGCRTATRASRW